MKFLSNKNQTLDIAIVKTKIRFNGKKQFIQKRELWVTTQIKCNYHPVMNEKEILSKYYPLEIIESTENIEGFITKYTVEKVDIK